MRHCQRRDQGALPAQGFLCAVRAHRAHHVDSWRSEEHTSELQSRLHVVCRLLLEKKKEDAVAGTVVLGHQLQALPRRLKLVVRRFAHDLKKFATLSLSRVTRVLDMLEIAAQQSIE